MRRWIVGVAVVVGLVTFAWANRWQYVTSGERLYRVNRFTSTTEVIAAYGQWLRLPDTAAMRAERTDSVAHGDPFAAIGDVPPSGGGSPSPRR